MYTRDNLDRCIIRNLRCNHTSYFFQNVDYCLYFPIYMVHIDILKYYYLVWSMNNYDSLKRSSRQRNVSYQKK